MPRSFRVCSKLATHGVQVPNVMVQERIVKVCKIQQRVRYTVHQDQHQTIEQPTIVQKTIHRKKPIIQEHIKVPKIVEQIVPVVKYPEIIPQRRIQQRTVEQVVHVPKA